MKRARRIARKTLMDRERSEDIRQTCRINKINDWRERKMEQTYWSYDGGKSCENSKGQITGRTKEHWKA